MLLVFHVLNRQLRDVHLPALLVHLRLGGKLHDLEFRPANLIAHLQELGGLLQVARVQKEGITRARSEDDPERLTVKGLHLQLRDEGGMRILLCGIGLPLPLFQIVEAVAVRILSQHVRFRNRQAELLQPFVRHRRMHLRVLQRGGQAVRPNEMFFRHEEPGAPAESPLRRLAQLLRRRLQLERFFRGRGGLG